MAYRTRKEPDAIMFALVAANNLRQEAIVASFFHADITQRTTGHYSRPVLASEAVAAANGTDDATNSVLLLDIKSVANRHLVDDLAHNTAVSAVIATADGTDATTNTALVNAVKAALNVHYTASNVHFNNDGTNTITNADATNQATASTLANEIKTKLNAHIISAPLGAQIRLVNA